MSRTIGFKLTATPCCGAHYRRHIYASRNYSANEYWSDGFRLGSLMPNDHGLRACRCGAFYLMEELKDMGRTDQYEVPLTTLVAPVDLPRAIGQARTPRLEIAARLDYWHELNHPYRARYRAYREAERQANPPPPLQVTSIPPVSPGVRRPVKLEVLPTVAPQPIKTPVVPANFSCPTFEPTQTQTDNMRTLLSFDNAKEPVFYPMLKAELCRELGEFKLAEQTLQQIETDQRGRFWHVLSELAQKHITAPVRYTP